MEAAIGGRPRAIRKKEVYNQMHLPEGTLQAWKTHIIPAWRDFAGSQENPWHTTTPELCDDLKEIWDIVYPTRAHQVIKWTAQSLMLYVFIFRFKPHVSMN